jgi:hypothetical protein
LISQNKVGTKRNFFVNMEGDLRGRQNNLLLSKALLEELETY